jgi:hypothetical protein
MSGPSTLHDLPDDLRDLYNAENSSTDASRFAIETSTNMTSETRSDEHR